MNNDLYLGRDYVKRARKRLVILGALEGVQAWADIVRESQEIVELALKGVLKCSGVEIPRSHDVSTVLEQNVVRLPKAFASRLSEICGISRSLRKDRELAYYGAEDVLPDEFFKAEDAREASGQALQIVIWSEEALASNPS